MKSFFQTGHHYSELDALRGIAAFTVLITHYSNLFLVQGGPFVSLGSAIQRFAYTPLGFLLAGHEAVMLFFVHSGFVLSLQFLKGRKIRYGSFAVRRIFRIYVPYLGCLITALLCCKLLYRGHIGDLSSWFNTPWSEGVTGSSVRDHLTFIGNFRSDRFDPVLWSLVHELRISFLFPVLVLLLMKLAWKTNLLFAAAMSAIGLSTTIVLIHFGINQDYFLTVHYISMFICGFVLAQNINPIYSWYTEQTRLVRVLLAVSGFCMYTFSRFLPGRLQYLQDIPITIGACLLLVTGVCSFRTSTLLRVPALKFFGDISYSLYLYHAVVLLAFVHAFYGKAPISIVLLGATATTIIASWLSYKYVELPAIRCGKFCSARYEETARSLSNVVTSFSPRSVG